MGKSNRDIGKPIWVFETVLDFPYDKIRSMFFAIEPGEFKRDNAPRILAEVGVFRYASEITIEGGPNDFLIHCKGFQMKYEIGATIGEHSSSLILEGQWWYRGVYSIASNDGKTMLRQEVFNISPGISRLFFPIIKVQGTKEKLESGFKHLAKSLSTQFGPKE
jgi:hypothetical protein